MNLQRLFLSALIAAAASFYAGAQQTVTAPESPYGFEPLEMHVFPHRDFSIVKYGARPGNVKANTLAFAKAMEACSKAGGGRVVVPAGEWLSGPVHFRSNCELCLSEGAKMLFEDSPELYLPAVRSSWEGTECMNYSPLIYGDECENVAISGPGTVESKMDFWRTWFKRSDQHVQATRQLYAMCSTGVPIEYRHMEDSAHMRPQLIQFNRCKNVQLAGVHIRQSPFWTVHLYLCKDVWVHDLDEMALGQNNDGIDIEMTQHALVENCSFNQGDDAVVIKSGRNQDAWRLNTPTQDVVVRNCTIVKAHCIMGIGSEMAGGVPRVYMHDCKCTDDVFRMLYLKTNHRRGGFIEDVSMDNVYARKTDSVFEIDTDVLYQWRDIVPTFETKITRIRNIGISNSGCDPAGCISDLKGDARDPIQGVDIENIHAGTVTKFIDNAVNARNVIVRNITWDNVSDTLKTKLPSSFAQRQSDLAAPKPLYQDPVLKAPTDPIIVQNRDTKIWYMFYTSRRATLQDGKGAEWVHGSPIGIATSRDLVHWDFLQNAEIGYKPDADPTYWAPALVDDGKEYHMFLTYVPGVFSEWNHPRHIVHLTSSDLIHWKFQSVLKLMSDKVIDADVERLADGTWRMWYNQEPGGKLIAYADSKDLCNWDDHGLVNGIGNCEGPKAFFWKGSWWLVCDEWKGFAVYRSEDALNWTRQPGNILGTPGNGRKDGVKGNHCDVVIHNGHAYIFYFTANTPDNTAAAGNGAAAADPSGRGSFNPRETFIQVAELLSPDGKTLTCDRDAGCIIR